MVDLIDRAALGIGRENPLVFDKVEYAHGWNCVVVPAVRCKECTYKRITKGSMEVNSYSCNCTWSPCRGRIVEPSFFCFYGERKEDG